MRLFTSMSIGAAFLFLFGLVANAQQLSYSDKQQPKFGGFGFQHPTRTSSQSGSSAKKKVGSYQTSNFGTFSSQAELVSDNSESVVDNGRTTTSISNDFRQSASEFLAIEKRISHSPKKFAPPSSIYKKNEAHNPLHDVPTHDGKKTVEDTSTPLFGIECIFLLLVLVIHSLSRSFKIRFEENLVAEETRTSATYRVRDSDSSHKLRAQRNLYIQDTLQLVQSSNFSSGEMHDLAQPYPTAENSTIAHKNVERPLPDQHTSAQEYPHDHIYNDGDDTLFKDNSTLERDPCLLMCRDLREVSRLEELVANQFEQHDASSVEQMLAESVHMLSTERQHLLGPLVSAVAVDQQSMEVCNAAVEYAKQSTQLPCIAGASNATGDAVDDLLQQYLVLGEDDIDTETKSLEHIGSTYAEDFVSVSARDCIDTSGGDSGVSDRLVADFVHHTGTDDVNNSREAHGGDVTTRVRKSDDYQVESSEVVMIRALIENSFKNHCIDETELCTVALNVVEAQKRQTAREESEIATLRADLRRAWCMEMEIARKQQAEVKQRCDADRALLLRELQTTKTMLLRQIQATEDAARDNLIAELKTRKHEVDQEHGEVYATAVRLILVSWLVVSAAVVFDTAVGARTADGAAIPNTVSFGYLFDLISQFGRLLQFGCLFLIQGLMARAGLGNLGTGIAVAVAARYVRTRNVLWCVACRRNMSACK
eukprot:m.890814 g.890814  ORF g.890814 m.890814 type:complete len:708 (+) comp23652_c1_seq19:197-2320(+)